MPRVVALLTMLLWTFAALPCSVPIGGQAAADEWDRTEQRRLVGELAGQADAIFIATAAVTGALPESVVFRVQTVLKGPLDQGAVVSYRLPDIEDIGCSVADNFHNVRAADGVNYLVYAREGQLLRAAQLKRTWPEISAGEETRLIRRRLAANDV